MPIAGDLSQRRYYRLIVADEDPVILMDSSQDAQSARRFCFITEWLLKAGLAAPRVLARDLETGFLIVEDFGDQTAGALVASRPDFRSQFLDASIDLLVMLRRVPPPELQRPDAAELADWTAVIDAHYPGVDLEAQRRFRGLLETDLSPLLMECSVSLRDFHAENVMWLDGRKGVYRLGLLDYQDAFLTHPVYDLVSLLTDARIEISREERHAYIQAYATQSGDDHETLRLAFALFSAQRNMRILGIFALAAKSGKPHHLPKLPRVHGYLAEALEHPVFDAVRDQVLRGLPDPQVAAERLAL